jgi:hypothetical protein
MDRHYKDNSAAVTYDPHTEVVLGYMDRMLHGEEFHEFMQAILDAVRETRTHGLVIDTSKSAGYMRKDDREWAGTTWRQQAVAAGLTHLGVVLPDSIMAKLNYADVLTSAEKEIYAKTFDRRHEAVEWIVTCDPMFVSTRTPA